MLTLVVFANLGLCGLIVCNQTATKDLLTAD